MRPLLSSSWIFLPLLLSLGPVVEAQQYDVEPYQYILGGAVNGERRQWHKITIGFEGPMTNETATPNPFADYRLDVKFTHELSGKEYLVPGYYAADGNAANTGASSGPVWLVHFTPDETETWAWEATFVSGVNVAQNGGGISAGYFDGANGAFVVDETDKTGRDHRGKGRLQYVGEHHLRFNGTGEYFLKAGADSPESFLQYEDFDNTPNNTDNAPRTFLLKTWEPHAQDYEDGDPTWAGGKGSEMVGALNYLANEGMNAFSFIPMAIGGGDSNAVFPYISVDPADFLRMDCSKLAQWEVIFEHADRKGLFMHFKTQEQARTDNRMPRSLFLICLLTHSILCLRLCWSSRKMISYLTVDNLAPRESCTTAN